jgi:glycosyltransferase involved in cell wall biosynthesis
MKVLFISGREPAYVRNAIMLKALRGNRVEIIECSDSSASYQVRLPRVLLKFLSLKNTAFDCVFVGFFGQPLVPIVRRFTEKPIILDAFLSSYDTMCFERKRFRPDSLAGKFFYWLDKHSCESSDRILLDTNAHIDYFVSTFGLRRDKFQRVFVGADESLFYPREADRKDDKFRVFYYASYLPLHGIEFVISAAGKLRRHKDIEFKIVGKGPQQKKILRLADDLGINNITFVDWVPYKDLPLEIAKADLCLGGHFADIGKAKRVIAGKTYQFIAMKKPVIVGDCQGNRELFTHKENALMVTMADAGCLAQTILEMKDSASLREKIAEKGYKTFLKYCSVDVIGRELADVVYSFYKGGGSEAELLSEDMLKKS